MIVLLGNYGRLGNLLFQMAMLYSSALEHNYRVINIPAWFLKDEFPLIEKDKVLKLSTGSSFADRVIKRFLSKFIKRDIEGSQFKISRYYRYQQIVERKEMEYFNLREKKFMVCAKHGVVILFGWFYEDMKSWIIHKERIKETFQPNIKTLNIVSNILLKFKSNDCIVGVHIRRSDYKEAYNGKYYFENEDWVNIIFNVYKQLLRNNRNPVFVICSDEQAVLALPTQIKVYYSCEAEYIDITLLSKCNILIGVMSTFVCWASFIGSVPLIMLDENRIIDIEKAKICAGYLPNQPIWENSRI